MYTLSIEFDCKSAKVCINTVAKFVKSAFHEIKTKNKSLLRKADKAVR